MTSCLNLSGDESPECPLCMELFELDDINFYPCTCGYQICRFCWNKLRTEGNGLCPACRQAYSENPADFKPLTTEEMARIKAEKRQKDQAKKLKISENRKHLANVRVVQKNLVFVVGLSPRLADAEILRKPDYFGKFGKIHKVVINHSTQYAGSQLQGPSASAYVTYFKSEDALRAIQAVNNIFIDGRTLKASLGTTKYCSHFMKNQSCPKNDCMYLHELGDDLASFTKEQMQQGKHTEYEKALHEEMIAGLAGNPPSPIEGSTEGRREEENNEWRTSPGEYPPTQNDWNSSSGGVSGSRAGGGGSAGGQEGEWGNTNRGGGGGGPPSEQSWPDLAQQQSSNPGGGYGSKGRLNNSSSKEEDKSIKSKSSESSEEESGSLPPDCLEDQVVPCPSPPSAQPPSNHREPNNLNLREGSLPSLGSITPARQPRHLPSQPAQPAKPVESRQDQGWLDNELKVSNSFLDDDVDDLGFDPFHETQKGLADLLESEAAEAQQTYKAPSPDPDWSSAPSSTSRARLPPPGFHTAQPAHNPPPQHLGTYMQNPVDSLFGPAPSRGGRGGAPGFGSATSPHDLMFGLGKDQGGLSRLAGLGGDVSRLGLDSQGPQQSRILQNQHNVQQGLADNFTPSKDWQDGLRALLPNVNVSFGQQGQNHGNGSGGLGGLGNGAPGLGGLGLGGQGGLGGLGQGGLNASGGHFGLQNSGYQNSFNQERQQQQQNSNWGNSVPSNGLGNDWTMLDPAIVSGQLSGHPDFPGALRPDSPPNWIRDNLEQLTSESGSSSQLPYTSSHAPSALTHAFNGLGLGGSSSVGARRGGLGGWGGATATPPPGFSHHNHRQPLGQQGYQGFKAPEGPKIGDFN